MKRLILLVVAVALTGCASVSEMMVNPKTGATQNCAAAGFGVIGVPVALAMQADCEKKLKALGYVSSDDFQKTGATLPVNANSGPSALKVDSNPQGAEIYAGPFSDKANIKIGVTPFEMKNPTGGRFWDKECYKLVKDGYFDSEVVCYEPVDGDRTVMAKLTAKSGK